MNVIFTSSDANFSPGFNSDGAFDLNMEQHYGGAEFEGQYEYTPSNQTQIVEIIGKTARENIVINPIPQNYGLITWNGSELTVS